MELLRDLDAFYLEHYRCGDLDSDVEEEPSACIVWMACSCGAELARRVTDG